MDDDAIITAARLLGATIRDPIDAIDAVLYLPNCPRPTIGFVHHYPDGVEGVSSYEGPDPPFAPAVAWGWNDRTRALMARGPTARDVAQVVLDIFGVTHESN